MKRRDFLAMVGASAAGWPLAAVAQQRSVPRAPGGRPWLIALLTNNTREQALIQLLAPFLKGLRDLGYVEGRDFIIEARYGDGDPNLVPINARALVAIGPDLIVTSGVAQVAAAHDATTTIPTLGTFQTGATFDLIVGNQARPERNVTGIVSDQASLSGKHLELVLEIVPTATRIGVLVNAAAADRGQATRDAVAAAANAHNVVLTIADVTQPSQVGPAFASLAENRVNGVVLGSGNVFAGDRARTVGFAAQVRLPTVYNEQGYVEAGGLISYGFSRAREFARLASFADLILRGTRVAEIPVESSPNFEMAVNLKTAKSLGLTIPPPVLFRADIVIE
jgi:putative ABC transport system substrate-binding protein